MVQKTNNFLTKAASIVTVGTAAVGAAKAVGRAIDNFKTMGSKNRSKNIRNKGEQAVGNAKATIASRGSRDWRVKLGPVPSHMKDSPVFEILLPTEGLVFPYTPSINVTHAANYQPLDITHSNYPYMAYQNSKVESINIVAPFYVEDSFEALYWVAAVHLLRSLTKMSFGENSPNLGAPPTTIKLSGYGDFVFNNVPVVVTNFTMEMPNDVDYISTGLGNYAGGVKREFWTSSDNSNGISWVPVKSQLMITLQPVYSRQRIKEFSLDKFVNGEYIVKDKKGFI